MSTASPHQQLLDAAPRSWKLMPLSSVVTVVSGATPSKDEAEFWSGSIPWVSPKDMKVPVISDTEDHVSEAALAASPLKLVQPPAVLLVIRGMILAHTVPVALTARPVTLNQDMKALRPRVGVHARFLAYQLRALGPVLLSMVEEAGHGTRCLRTDLWRKLMVAMPPDGEQRAIADFLDRKTADIDALVEKKEHLLTLLSERARAVLDAAIWRGAGISAVDGRSAPLCVEPSSCMLLPLRHHLRWIEQGWSPSCENRLAEEGEWGVLKVGCVNGGVFEPAENKALPETLQPIRQYEIRLGDLLVSRANTRELLGSTALVERAPPKLLLCDKLFRLHIDEGVDASYLALAMRTSVARWQIEREATGASSSMQNIGQDTLYKLSLPCPSLAEQRRIAAELKAREAASRALQDTVGEEVRKLREYRHALITAAVTGQLDVAAQEAA